MLDTVDRIWDIKSDTAEIHGSPAQTERINDTTHNGYYKRRDLLREQISPENSHKRYKQNRKSYHRISKHIKDSLCCHPDKSNSSYRTKESGSWQSPFHPRTNESAQSLHSSPNKASRDSRRPCEHRIVQRIVERHNPPVQHNKHSRSGYSGRKRRDIRTAFFFGKSPAHKRIINPTKHQSNGHARYDGPVYNLIRPSQHP